MCTDVHAQSPTTTPLTLGSAARMAAERSASTEAAKARSSQADARVSQRRSEFLPTISTSAQLGTRSFNTASMGIDVPTAMNPDGEVRGPVRSVDMRAQITQRLLDVPAVLRWRAAGADADAVHYRADAAADDAAERGANAYLRVLRAEARISARQADSLLAAELLDIARRQVNAGVGIALDVTRAESQLADARARLIATRGDRDRSVLLLRHEFALADAAPLVIADSLTAPATNEPVAREDEIICMRSSAAATSRLHARRARRRARAPARPWPSVCRRSRRTRTTARTARPPTAC